MFFCEILPVRNFTEWITANACCDGEGDVGSELNCCFSLQIYMPEILFEDCFPPLSGTSSILWLYLVTKCYFKERFSTCNNCQFISFAICNVHASYFVCCVLQQMNGRKQGSKYKGAKAIWPKFYKIAPLKNICQLAKYDKELLLIEFVLNSPCSQKSVF